MTNMKGPAIFLAQFMSDEPPFDSLEGACLFMKECGYEGVQIPTWDGRCIDLKKAAESKTYAEEWRGTVESYGVRVTELSTHLQGQLVAVHPAYDTLFDAFAPAHVQGNPGARTEWAIQQLMWAGQASKNLGIDVLATFSGAFLWPIVYPWPQRPAGLVDTGFKELAQRWEPILDKMEDCGVDLCFELHPGEDLHDGVSFEAFLEATGHHPRVKLLYDPSHFVLQQLDYLDFIDIYRDYIRMFHVKDAEFTPSGRQGVYGGYQSWANRAGRFRSLGDGQVDFKQVFTKLAQYGFDGWPVVEWECAIKDHQQGAREGAPFVRDHTIKVAERSFDDFAGGESNEESNRRILGLQ